MPGVELKASVRGGLIVVVLRGDLDVTGAADAEAAIAALVAPGQSLIIDMSALDFMDCASLRALLRVQTLARRGGGDVVLAAPQPHLLRLLALNGRDGGVLRSGQRRGCVAVPAAAGRGTLGGGLRCVLHA
jgi:anti-sigma B factor antagonist